VLEKELKEKILHFQENEITEHFIYKHLAKKAKGKNKEILKRIGNDELRHYNEWKKFTGEDVKPRKLFILKYLLIAKIFGLTFSLKLMEKGERNAEKAYREIAKLYPEAEKIIDDEEKHEKILLDMIEEEKINYVSSMVLGLNDALVELTGALAGFTFALQKTLLIGVVGLITGIAASLSMASSEYLAKKAEEFDKPLKASFYTGLSYILAVLMLVFPFFILANPFVALAISLIFAILIIFIFTFFISVVKERDFKKLFLEMAIISMGIAGISFAIGWFIKAFMNIGIE